MKNIIIVALNLFCLMLSASAVELTPKEISSRGLKVLDADGGNRMAQARAVVADGSAWKHVTIEDGQPFLVSEDFSGKPLYISSGVENDWLPVVHLKEFGPANCSKDFVETLTPVAEVVEKNSPPPMVAVVKAPEPKPEPVAVVKQSAIEKYHCNKCDDKFHSRCEPNKTLVSTRGVIEVFPGSVQYPTVYVGAKRDSEGNVLADQNFESAQIIRPNMVERDKYQ